MTVKIPFPGASWNKKVSEIGLAEEKYQHYAERFRVYAGGTAPLGQLGASVVNYSVPIYDCDIQKPNTKVRIYQTVWARDSGSGYLLGLKPGDWIPWNFSWKPGTGNDRLMILENFPLGTEKVTVELWMVYDGFYNAWDWFGSNNANGFSETFPTDIWANPLNKTNKKIVVSGASVTKGIYEPGWKTIVGRGMGINKRALITTADEVASGDIGHALEVTIANTLWTDKQPGILNEEYFAPATRPEFTYAQVSNLNFRPYWDRDKTHNLPEGLRICISPEVTGEAIDKALKEIGFSATLLYTAGTFVRAMRDYGLIISETGGWGRMIETTGVIGADKNKWNAMGITKDIDFGDLLNRFPLKIVKAAV